MAFTEDFDQFLDPADFGEAFTWSGNTIYGIFDNETYVVEDRGGVEIQIQRPSVLFKDADVVGMAEGDTVTRVLDAQAYAVRLFAPEGTGMTVIGLNK
jgi:hypothetical protein